MISVSSFWGGIGQLVLTVAAGILDRAVGYLRAGSIAGLVLLCGSLSGWVGSVSVAQAEEALPDGRVYEMVTPPNNQDANVYVPLAEEAPLSQGVLSLLPFQVATDGSAVTYTGDATTGGEGEIIRGLGDQYLARRTAAGWQQTVIQPNGRHNPYFEGFSSDLSKGFLVAGGGEAKVSPLTSDAPAAGYGALYMRNDFGGESGLEESLYQPLFSSPIAFNRTAEGPGGFGVDENVEDDRKVGEGPVFAGSTDGSGEFFFEANDDVTASEDPLRPKLDARIKAEIEHHEEHDFLYESVGGRASVVDVLPGPGGEVAVDATFGGPPAGNPERNPPDFDGAISSSGQWVYWTDESTGTVYVRVAGARTVQVSAGRAQYWTSAEDGRYAFYVENEQLYRYDAESELREALTTPGGGVLGVVGASGDGSYLYFAADGVLAAGASAQTCEKSNGNGPGTLCNFYVWHDGVTRLVAVLSAADGSEAQPFISIPAFGALQGYGFGDWQPGLGHRTATVTAGGDVVFMSDQSLPVVGFPQGYPGGGADEVYEYRPDVNRVFCLSCSSSGEPLHGGAAAFLPVSWDDAHQPEWVADEGNRVFFDSEASLVPQDTNGKQDVYEWEREGTGTCQAATAVNGGCIYLLSGGTSEADSWFIGAGESGEDVFIATRAQLSPLDKNDAFDLYDARVGGVQPVTEPLCTGTGCQGPPEPAPTFATPASVTFAGVGNFPPPVETKAAAKPKPKAKSLTRAQKLAKALKSCRKQSKAKRASCEAKARGKFGPARSKSKQQK